MLATVTISTGSAPVQVARADMTKDPVKQIGPIVTIQPESTMEFKVNDVQGLVIREKP